MVKLAAAMFVIALAGVARADDAQIGAAMAKARADRTALRYRQALDGIEAAIALGKASAAETAELYRLAGELAAGLDESSTAQRWFARWIAIVPDARLPADASPKLRQPLEAARAELGGKAIGLAIARQGGSVRVGVEGDVLGLVRRVRLGAADGLPGATFVVDEAPVDVAVGLDEHGNVLIEERVPAARVTRARPIVARWQTWAIAGGALAATGGGFAWRTGVAQDEFDRLKNDGATFGETEAVRRRGERHALTANVAFGAAAVTTVVSVVLAVRGRAGERVVVTAALAPDHAAVALAGRF